MWQAPRAHITAEWGEAGACGHVLIMNNGRRTAKISAALSLSHLSCTWNRCCMIGDLNGHDAFFLLLLLFMIKGCRFDPWMQGTLQNILQEVASQQSLCGTTLNISQQPFSPQNSPFGYHWYELTKWAGTERHFSFLIFYNIFFSLIWIRIISSILPCNSKSYFHNHLAAGSSRKGQQHKGHHSMTWNNLR